MKPKHKFESFTSLYLHEAHRAHEEVSGEIMKLDKLSKTVIVCIGVKKE